MKRGEPCRECGWNKPHGKQRCLLNQLQHKDDHIEQLADSVQQLHIERQTHLDLLDYFEDRVVMLKQEMRRAQRATG